jgi:ABC-type multidrug transport system fused ATPase/permease subunit
MNPSQLIRRLLAHLHARRRVQLGIVLILMVLSGVAEALSLAAVLPFLWVLTNPQELWQWPVVQRLSPLLGVSQPAELLLPAALAFSAAILMAGAIRLLNVWVNSRLSAAIGSDLSVDAFHRSVYQPYSVHLARNSSVLIASLTSQLELTVLALNQCLQLLSAVIILAGLLVALFLVDWQVALIAGVMASVIYGTIVGTAKSALLRNSEHITKAAIEQVKILRESFGAIRDLILNGTQRFFFETYRRVDRPMRQRQAQNQFLSLYPRYAVEAISVVAIVALAFGLMTRRGGSSEVVPLLGILALAAQRLLPTAQLIYSAWTDIRAKSYAVRAVLEVLAQPLPEYAAGNELSQPLLLKSDLSFDRVAFRYHPDGPQVIHGLSFRINRGERIGIVGSTGSGKSTTLDLLMGLLAPTSGRICVDGADLHDPLHPTRLLEWRAAITHVPQSVYLADSSFAANIAFGILPEQIDMDRVRRAARQAQIADFIESSAQGYDGIVGERGVRLSGGQRQRIGIARALYRQAQVLVFDEATNALDNTTEQAVMEAIEGLSRDLTIIMIAHRLSTVARCNRIFELNNGLLRAEGSYNHILSISPSFQRLAEGVSPPL